jgi:hypothetical protein
VTEATGSGKFTISVGSKVANEPDLQSIQKRNRSGSAESAPTDMTRRRSLNFLGAGSAALTVGSTSVLTSCPEGEEKGTAEGTQEDSSEPYLEAARIGSLLFIFADSPNDQIGSSSIIDTFATRLSAQPLK